MGIGSANVFTVGFLVVLVGAFFIYMNREYIKSAWLFSKSIKDKGAFLGQLADQLAGTKKPKEPIDAIVIEKELKK